MKSLVQLAIHLVVMLLLASCAKQTASPQEYLQQADTYIQDNNYRAAVISLKNAIQADPKLAQARFELGRVYLVIGDAVSAEKELIRARELGLDDAELEVDLQQARLWQNKFEDVLAQTTLSDTYPAKSQADLHSGLVLAAIASEKLKLAQTELEKAESLGSTSATQFAKASLLLAEGKKQAAKSVLAGLLLQDKKHFPAWLEQGRLFIQEGALSDAEGAFRLVWDGERIHGMTPVRFKAALNLTQVLLMQNKMDAAKETIAELSKSLPDHPVVKYFVALMQYRDKDYDSARTNLLDAVNSTKDYLPAQLLLGATLYALGSYEQADVYISRFVSRVPSHMQARKLLAATRLRQNRPDEVMDMLEPLVKNNSGDQQLLAMIGKAAISSGAVERGTDYLKKAVKADPGNTALRTELANAYLNQGDVGLAVKELEMISGKDADRRDSLLIAASLRAGDIKQARALVEKLLAREQSAAALTMAGGVELIGGGRGAARADFNKTPIASPDYVAALNYLARIAMEDNDLPTAKGLLNKILKKEPGHLLALLGMAQITEQQGGAQEDAVEWVEKARKSDPMALQPVMVLSRYYLKKGVPEKAIQIAKEYGEASLNSPTALLLLAQTQLAAEQAQEAAITIEKFIKHQPGQVSGYLARSKIQAALGNPTEARASLKKALSLQPDSLAASLALARLEIGLKNYKAATTLAQAIQKSHQTSNIGYQLHGDIWAHQSNWNKALNYYQKASKVHLDRDLLLKISSVYGKLERNSDALKLLSAWKRNHPEDGSIDLMLSQFQTRTGETAGAIKSLEQTVQKQPNNVAALNNLAWMYYENGHKEALSTARKAHELMPKIPEITDTYAWIMLNTGGSKSEALTLLREASELAPKSAEIEYHLAEALIQNGKTAEAKEMLQSIVSSGAKFNGLEKAKARLNEL